MKRNNNQAPKGRGPRARCPKCGCPSRLPQEHNNTTHRPATIQRIRLGATADGRLTAIAHESWSGAALVDGHGRLCGIVSIGDVVKNHLDEIQREASELREYISGNN